RLRKYMTGASDLQLEQLAQSDHQEYLRVQHVALQAILVDQLPRSADVQIVESSGSLPLVDAGDWTGIIARKGSGERVPCKAIFPRGWDGRVVIWAHPDGCEGLRADQRDIKLILDARAAVLTVDPFNSGRFVSTEMRRATRP